jgi:hypothetical protein
MNGTLSASSVNVGNGAGSVSAATITASGEIDGGSLDIEGDADINGTTNLDNTDIDGTFTMDGTAFDVNGTTTVAIDNTNTTNGVTINTVTSGGKVFIGHTTSETTVNDNLSVTGDLAVDGTSNLDNTDVDGTLVVDGSNISLDSTSTLNIDNSNTSNGITIGTATSGVPIQLGHSTSNVRINDNLVVTGNTVMNGTLSATTSLNVGNGNGTISASSVTGTILRGILGSDAAPVTAYINNGEIDGTTLGGESAVTIAGANYIDIENSDADNVALSVIGHSSQSASILEVRDTDEEGTLWFGVAANGRCTISSAVMNGGTINNTSIGATTRSTGAFTTMDVNSTLVVTGNTVLNGTLSATTALKVGNGDGLISAATVSAPVITGTLSTAAQTNITSLGTLTNLNVDNININGDTITSSGDLEIIATGNDITVDTDNFTIESAASVKPSFTLKSTINSNKPAVQQFVKDKGAAGADGDIVGETYYIGDNDAQEQITMVQVSGQVSDASDGAEEGEYKIAIKNTAHVSTPQESFKLTGNGALTDATIGYGVTSTTTIAGDLVVTTDLDVDGVTNLDNTDIDGTLVVDGSNISLDSTSTFNIDNSNTTNGITIGTATSGVPIQLGHSTSETRINDNLVVTGNTVMNGTLSATTSCKIGNGDGLISGETVSANSFIGTKHILRSMAFYVNDNPIIQNSLYFGSSLGNTNSNWNDPQDVGGTISSVSSFTIAEDDMNWGMILPFNVSKVDITCSLRPNLGTGEDFTIVLYTGVRSDDTNTDLTLTKVAIGQTTFTTQRYVTNDITYTANLNAGTMIYVGVGTETASPTAKNARGIMQIIVTQR